MLFKTTFPLAVFVKVFRFLAFSLALALLFRLPLRAHPPRRVKEQACSEVASLEFVKLLDQSRADNKPEPMLRVLQLEVHLKHTGVHDVFVNGKQTSKLYLSQLAKMLSDFSEGHSLFSPVACFSFI